MIFTAVMAAENADLPSQEFKWKTTYIFFFFEILVFLL